MDAVMDTLENAVHIAEGLDWVDILTYVGVIFAIWLLFKVFAWPIKTFVKMLVNSVIGALMLLAVNYFGADLLNGFTLPITWWTALTVGILGVPGIILLIALKFIL